MANQTCKCVFIIGDDASLGVNQVGVIEQESRCE
jgi:hypothetical protein